MWAVVDHVLSGLVIGVGVLASVLGLIVAGFGVSRRRAASEQARATQGWAKV